jgi:hypothetical protein
MKSPAFFRLIKAQKTIFCYVVALENEATLGGFE